MFHMGILSRFGAAPHRARSKLALSLVVGADISHIAGTLFGLLVTAGALPPCSTE